MIEGWWHETVEPQRRAEAAAFFRQGYERHTQGALEAAVVCYKKSLELQPTAEAYRRSLAASPDYAPALQTLRRVQGLQN